VLLVVGSANSSNSNRLREIGEELGIPSYLVADGRQVDPAWLVGKETIGITAGASAPDVLVDDVVGALAKLGPVEIQALQGVEEKITFRLPRELLEAS
jgi:4-hydroxy-3-methylbut-2-enyl diphosphate reductase